MRNLIVALAVLGIVAHGQAFEVTSVKPGRINRANPGTLPTCASGRFAAVAPIVLVIQWAYDVTMPTGLLAQQLPPWATGTSGQYDIQATTGGPATEAQCRKMLQALLADRFKFASHWDSKEGQVYDLVVAKGGHKLRRVTDADQGPGMILSQNGSPPRNAGEARGLTMADFAKFLSTTITSARLLPTPVPVFDKTGLDGMYKITLAYSIPRLAPKQVFSDPELEGAVEQQLGLRLEGRRGPVETFVIDHIEMPDPN